MKNVLRLLALSLMAVSSLSAQNISGDWQTTVGKAKDRHRIILHIDKSEDGDLKAQFFAIDDSPDGFTASPIIQSGSEVSFAVSDLEITYKGTLSPDGKSITGEMVWDGKGSATFVRATPETAWPHDIHCECSISFTPVEKGVKLEVLDWGGSGRPLVLLAGLGDTAHAFDALAHKLIANYHVYGITRRGFGDSSAPPPTEANYNADRLGDDVLAVADALHLQRPVLAGHSIAGEELSSVGSRHPEKIAALIYLDAAYGYAFYNPAYPDFQIDALTLRKKIDNFLIAPNDIEQSISELLAELPEFEKMLHEQQKAWAGVPSDPPDQSPGGFGTEEAIRLGERKYTHLDTPVLAIFANPHKAEPMPKSSAADRAAVTKNLLDYTANAIKALEAGDPSAHVVVVPNADHYVFMSNEADVLREINSFLVTLPPTSPPPAQSAAPSH